MKNTVKRLGIIAVCAAVIIFSACSDGGGSGSSDSAPAGMVKIPAGTFMMGSPESEPNRLSARETQHSVTLTKSFYMGKYQVTQKQWKAVMEKTIEEQQDEDDTTDYGRGDNHPIYYVTWYDTIEFCNKLSIKGGLTPVYSLNGKTNPAEWEYACRGSYTNKATETNTKPFGIGDGTKMISGMANFRVIYPYDLAHDPAGNYSDTDATGYVGKTTAVGSYAANNYGLYDMHGNVWEWCWDWWYDSYSDSPANDPAGAVTGSFRVLRGGSWDDYGQYLRSALRGGGNPSVRDEYLGFWLVRS